MSEPVPHLLKRPVAKLALFGLAAVTSVYLGFIGLSVPRAEQVVKYWGYYFVLAAFVLWIVALWRLWRDRTPSAAMAAGEVAGAGGLIAVLTLVALTAEPFRSKILFDEFVLQSTAFNMHFFRDTATMVRGYDLGGVFLSLDNYLDKRPNFYPFLISLLHDLTGYRPANAYAVNAALYPVTLALGYYLGRRLLRAMAGGVFAVLLLGSLPLLTQNATGSGMELLNVCMILAVAALGGAYLRRPDEIRLSALVIGAALLAQSRYESALYVAPVAAIVATGWWREKRVVLSWPAVIVPWLLLPCALQNKVVNATKWMWELRADQESRFSVSYLGANLRAAGEFLFARTAMFSNSFVLTLLGIAGLGVLAWTLIRRRAAAPDAERSDGVALAWFGLGALANTVLIMFYYWSSFTDPMATRFALPLYLVLLFAAVGGLAVLARRHSRWLQAGLALGCLGVVIAASRYPMALYSHLGIDEIEWEKRVVAARGPGQRLIITTSSTLPWLLIKSPSILVGRARLVADRIQYQLEHRLFTEILVLQTLRPTTGEGGHELAPDEVLPPSFKLQPVAQRRFGTKIIRVSRLLAIDSPASVLTADTAAP